MRKGEGEQKRGAESIVLLTIGAYDGEEVCELVG